MLLWRQDVFNSELPAVLGCNTAVANCRASQCWAVYVLIGVCVLKIWLICRLRVQPVCKVVRTGEPGSLNSCMSEE